MRHDDVGYVKCGDVGVASTEAHDDVDTTLSVVATAGQRGAEQHAARRNGLCGDMHAGSVASAPALAAGSWDTM